MTRTVGVVLAFVASMAGAAWGKSDPVVAHVDTERFVVHFARNSARIAREELLIIRRAATRSREAAASRVEVTGHADRTGSAEYNLTLSRRRTEAVIRELRRAGVAQAVLHADWRGEFEPGAESSGDSGAPDRRVVITVVY